MHRPWLLTTLACLALPGSALAQSGGVGAGDASTGTRVSGSHLLDGKAVALPGEPIRVRGAASAEPTRVDFVRGSRVVKTVDVTGQPIFDVAFTPATTGRVSVKVNGASRGQVQVLQPFSDLGESGPSVRFLQSRLHALHYAVPRHGHFEYATARAVIAYRKVNDFDRTTNATRGIYRAISAGRGAYKARFPGHGRHVEGDLTHQVFALVNPGGRVFRVYITSSGRPSLPTPTGTHRVYAQERGLNAAGQWNTSYFKRNCGVHGYFVVPTYAQSHCCLRLPITDSYYVRNWMKIGMIVDVFRRRNAAAP